MMKMMTKGERWPSGVQIIAGVTSIAVIVGLWLTGSGLVLADTAGDIGAHLATQGENIGKAISVLFYLGGMAAGGGAFMKLKANRDNPQQHPLSHAVVMGLVAAGLLFLPETFQTAGDTVYQSGATKNQIQGTTSIGGG
jgi:hypothetical protein